MLLVLLCVRTQEAMPMLTWAISSTCEVVVGVDETMDVNDEDESPSTSSMLFARGFGSDLWRNLART